MLNASKTHRHDGIFIRMLKLRDSETLRSLTLMFKGCTCFGIVPNIWKKSNLVPGHKKGDKHKSKIIVPFLYTNL